jgi:hypothetical protein
MPTRLPDDVIYRLQLRLECGESPKAIHEATKASRSTIYRVQLNLDLFGLLEGYLHEVCRLPLLQDTFIQGSLMPRDTT